jgi:ABC-type Mn2+/Zn2+ transport system ATPase subunit
MLALEGIIESINEHAKIYIDRMFDLPISVRIKNVKTVGKVSKLQLNTVIEYQGYTYDSVDELSGGERQRCELAFLLAVGDIMNTPILMLDECLNNLDSTINTEVITYLRSICINRLILIISHEAVRGIFDAEICVN